MSSSDAATTDDLVERVVEVTACTADEAKHYLGACANDVAAAVALYFEQGAGTAATSNEAAGSAVAVPDGEEEVRAPIAPVREQLILPEDDNFFASGSSNNSRLSRVTQRVKVCPLRDFAREGALMEEQLQATGVYSDPSTHRRRRERSAQMVVAGQAVSLHSRTSTSTSNSSRLGDLFRPPTDLLYSGSLAAAREFASNRQRWLLVNVQGDNFQSQTMNRDVWSMKDLKQLVRRQFVLWQVDNDSSEGRRFVAFYHCAKLPYLCVIDPRTGEEVWRSPEEPNQQNVLPDLRQFLRDHRDFDLEEASTSKRAAIEIDDDDDVEGAASCSSSTASTPKKRAKLLELTEEEQLELAIKNSMNENGGVGATPTKSNNNNNGNGSDCESLEEFDEEELKGAAISYEAELGTQTTELTAIRLRLLDAAGSDEVVQLRWPSDTKLKTLRLYIKQTHKHIPLEGYKLICAFPRKSLEIEHNDVTLKDLGLHPSANVHLTLDE